MKSLFSRLPLSLLVIAFLISCAKIESTFFISASGKVIGEVTTSVKEYALKIINSNDEKYEKYKNLAKTILNYGAASQEYFNYYVDSLANSDLTISDKKIDDIPNDQLLKYRNNDNFITVMESSFMVLV